MKRIGTPRHSLVLALAAILFALPAAAQEKGKSRAPEKVNRLRTEEVRRDDRRDHDDRDPRLQRRKGVPPGWCIGKGNPHNTPENCGWGSDRRDRDDDDDRYDDRRRDDRRDRDGRRGDRRYDDRHGSYDQAHRAFHSQHDRICRERAGERPFDVRWQLRVRTDCKATHDRWHNQTGSRH
ncbi:MAG: hypothetical protein M3483_05730 [Gemmatimonadota bacterium]|nr:hypothetical protein [Gemmatimonadota bacterium]